MRDIPELLTTEDTEYTKEESFIVTSGTLIRYSVLVVHQNSLHSVYSVVNIVRMFECSMSKDAAQFVFMTCLPGAERRAQAGGCADEPDMAAGIFTPRFFDVQVPPTSHSTNGSLPNAIGHLRMPTDSRWEK